MCIRDRINRDIVAYVDKIPAPGETVSGSGSAVFPGGKGSNQAVAMRRLARDVDAVVLVAVSYTHLRAHETVLDLVCRLLLEKKKSTKYTD